MLSFSSNSVSCNYLQEASKRLTRLSQVLRLYILDDCNSNYVISTPFDYNVSCIIAVKPIPFCIKLRQGERRGRCRVEGTFGT